MVRFIVSILLGAAATFLLFAFMAFLISGGDGRNAPPPPSAVIEIVTNPPESDVDQRRRTPPPPPPPPAQPPETPPNEPDNADNEGMNLDLGFEVDVGGTETGFDAGGMMTDGEATPIVRINPRYPPAAARDGINGWVLLRFTIDETGGVTDVEVIDSEPRRVFDQEARRALLRWKYKPKIVDGKAVRQPGQTVQLDFNLEQEQ
ncbi:energy transducer TonB [Pseudidiomarina aestuarii]|uniref:Protein TonB n=1 Tax=Pseudidiomarina aestuarii TaxID=624146 RepID=A0A2T4D5E8_9GAMM|nr:energy transducer TonB [Pseudidiomarina aestuarii]PTB85363.1 energy transducer TonB [Pseudidiomarina aestuarii]PTB89037.1 energy transducer TonB [Pseudidiomarina aestuarii]PTB89663.1 energy transducer TonB [Pseudidiomarina aestuarii]RUO41345.1 energy transducer TonB [Pseudidiomarina aestuarii]